MSRFAGFLLFVICLGSCAQEEDPTALVNVFNNDGSPAPSVGVRLYTEGDQGPGIYDFYRETNTSGRAIFEFGTEVHPGQEGFVVFQVRLYPTPSDSAEYGVIVVSDSGISERRITLD